MWKCASSSQTVLKMSEQDKVQTGDTIFVPTVAVFG